MWWYKRFRGGFVFYIEQKPRQFGFGGGQIRDGVEHAFGVLEEGDGRDFAGIEPDFHDLTADHVG